MGQSSSIPSAKDDKSYDESDSDQSIDSSEASYDDESVASVDKGIPQSLRDEVDDPDVQITVNGDVHKTKADLKTSKGIEEVLLQLQNISTVDLKKRMDIASLTRENILEVTRSHRDDLMEMNDMYANTEWSRDFEEKIAIRMLQLSPTLRNVRYKLVSDIYFASVGHF